VEYTKIKTEIKTEKGNKERKYETNHSCPLVPRKEFLDSLLPYQQHSFTAWCLGTGANSNVNPPKCFM